MGEGVGGVCSIASVSRDLNYHEKKTDWLRKYLKNRIEKKIASRILKTENDHAELSQIESRTLKS